MVLVRHDHQVPVAQRPRILVHLHFAGAAAGCVLVHIDPEEAEGRRTQGWGSMIGQARFQTGLPFTLPMPCACPLQIMQGAGVFAHLAVLQAQDLLQVLDLSVGADLGHVSIAHIKQLAPAERYCASLET